MLRPSLILAAALLTLSAAHAQAPASAPTPAAPTPAGATPAGATPVVPAAVPEAMPWNVPYGTPIRIDQAKSVAAAIAEARKHGWKLALTIVEPTGDLVYFEKMDDTQYASITISQAKARAAATLRRPTQVLEEAINGGSPATITLPGIAGSRGGFPLIENGKLIGAIGMSGALGAQDAVAAKAGADSLR